MKTKPLFLLLLAAVLALAAPRTVRAAADVSFDFFYDSLAPYGEWIEVEGNGLCWRPTGVDEDWVPYSDGYWAFTDAAWTWVSYEEFGGIVYHYGRWLKVEDAGWVWVPDYDWGPAWVSWRESDDYVGWAPLPPRARWRPEVGFGVWVDNECDIGPGFYNFCRFRDFGAPVLAAVIINRGRNVTIIRGTVNITNITYNNFSGAPLIYNGGPDYLLVSRRSSRPIPALKLVREEPGERGAFDRRSFHNPLQRGNSLVISAPVVAPPAQAGQFKAKSNAVIAASRATTGWGIVKDEKTRDDLRQHMRKESKGLTSENAPAKPVAASALKVLPAQADPNAPSQFTTGKNGKARGGNAQPIVAATPVPNATPSNPAVTLPGQEKPDDREKKGREKHGPDSAPAAVTGAPLKPFNGGPATPAVTIPDQSKTPDALDAEKNGGQNRRGKTGSVNVPPVITGTPPGVDPNAAAKAKAAADATAREQADIEKRRALDAEKSRASQIEAEKAKGIEAQKKQFEMQRQADDAKHKQLEAQQNAAAEAAKERAHQQQLMIEQQKAAVRDAENERHQKDAAAHADEQRRAAEAQHLQQIQAAKQQEMEARRQQLEAQKHAADDAAKQHAMEAQHNAQIQATQQQQQQQQGGQKGGGKSDSKDKSKDKDKDKNQ